MSSNYIKNIAVVGAGGRMGSYIISALLKEGKHNVTALTRPDSTSSMPSGVSIAKADYSDPTSLTAALKGQDALIITMSAQAPASSSIALVEAAASAGVKWIMPNAFGVDFTNENLGRDTGLAARFQPVVKRIDELGVSKWVALACSFWYEWSLHGSFGMGPDMYGFDLGKKTVIFFDGGENKINTSTWPQAGLAAARLFGLKIAPEGADDKAPTLQGFVEKKGGYVYCSSFLVSQRDMLASIIRVQGGSESDWKISHESSQERFESARKDLYGGNHMAFAKMLYSRSFFPGDGNFEKDGKLDNEVLGLPKEDLDEATKAAFEYAQVPL